MHLRWCQETKEKKKRKENHGWVWSFIVILDGFVYFWNLGMFYVCENLESPFSVLPSWTHVPGHEENL